VVGALGGVDQVADLLAVGGRGGLHAHEDAAGGGGSLVVRVDEGVEALGEVFVFGDEAGVFVGVGQAVVVQVGADLQARGLELAVGVVGVEGDEVVLVGDAGGGLGGVCESVGLLLAGQTQAAVFLLLDLGGRGDGVGSGGSRAELGGDVERAGLGGEVFLFFLAAFDAGGVEGEIFGGGRGAAL